MGGILEGVPAGFPIDSDAIAAEMALRKPTGRIGTPRREKDEVELVQGVTDGRADGRPILIRIANGDTDGSKYMKFYDTPRPGHADLPALLKFPDHDLRGSGQFSGRLTAAIVAAGAIAKQVIAEDGISVDAFTRSVGDVVDGSDRTAEDARGSRSYATRAWIPWHPPRCGRRMQGDPGRTPQGPATGSSTTACAHASNPPEPTVTASEAWRNASSPASR